MKAQIAEIYVRNRRDHRLAVQIESRLPRERGSESDATPESSRRGGVRAKGMLDLGEFLHVSRRFVI